jgi:hypothetical protein
LLLWIEAIPPESAMYRLVGVLTAAALMAVPLSAQAQQRYEQQPPPPDRQQPLTFPDRFAAANTTNDGCLTLRQAQRALPGVAREFPQIDVEQRGCVTLAEVRAFRQSQNAQMQQPEDQQQPAPPPPRAQPPQARPDGPPPPPAGY